VNDSENSLVNPQGEDVYVLDSGNDRIEYFTSTGTYLGQFNGSGEDLAVEGTAAPTGKFLKPGDIAVDNDPLSPSHGDVYVADVGHDVIDKFSATGKYEGQLTGGRCENEEEGEVPPCTEGKVGSNKVVPFSGLLDIAVDASGDVWVYEAESREEYGQPVGEAYEFSNTGGFLEGFGTGEGSHSPGFAVDSSGEEVYVETVSGRLDGFEKTTANRTIISESIGPLATLAIISSTNDLLIDEGSKIELFKSPIVGNDSPYRTFPSEGLSESAGIAVNGAEGEGTIYATQRVADDVDVLESEPAKAPEILSLSASTVNSASEGEFSAVINPENSETTYSFEYSTEATENSDHELELAGTIETAAGGSPLLAEFGKQTVSSPELPLRYVDTYYYRVLASNKLGTATSKVQAYTKIPLVENEKYSNLTSTSADLEATINPLFVRTYYRFEYAPEAAQLGTSEATTVLNKEGEVEPEGVPLPVNSGEIAGLQPGHTYYYRVVAENGITEYKGNANKGKPAYGAINHFEPYAPPVPTTGEAQSIVGTAATLVGTVDPEGAETRYYFAYIGQAGYEKAIDGDAQEKADPYAEGEVTASNTLAAGNQTQAVGPIPARGLLPGETYHYALVAVNKFAIQTIGPDRTFNTGAKALPAVSTGGASAVSQNSATLSGMVSTNGLETNYGFEIGTEAGNYGPMTGLGSIGGATTEEVHVTLGELQPGTTYYYRVTATNADGTEKGQPGSFTTPGFATLISPPASPPLIAYTSPGFPKEEKGSTGPSTKTLTNKQKLAKALKACGKKPKSKRAGCERLARRKYGVVKKRTRA
jgi:hypothetical protein